MYIQDVASFLPETRVPIEEYGAQINLAPAQIQVLMRYHGLRKVPVVTDMSYQELTFSPVRKLRARADFSQVRYVIHVCVNPAWPFAHVALGALKEELELWDAQFFSVGMHECASTIEALHLARILLKDEGKEAQALIVASDWDFRATRGLPGIPVCGDGSAAMLVGNKRGDHELLGATNTSNIEFASGIWKSPKEEIDYQKRFFEMVEKNIQLTLAASALTIADIKLVLPLNSSLTSLWMLARHLGMNRETFYTKNLQEMTHIFGADVMINLESALKEGALKKGDPYLMFLIGASGSFGSAAFRY